jgi:hypothetical protein
MMRKPTVNQFVVGSIPTAGAINPLKMLDNNSPLFGCAPRFP